MKKYFGIIFAICILVFSALLIVLPKQDFSENENRYLEEFPNFNLDTLLDGSFMKDLEAYVQDHFPFRNLFVNVKSNVELSLGKTENNNVYIADNGYLIEKNEKTEEHRLDRIAMIISNLSKSAKNVNTTVMIVPTSITINAKHLPKYAIEYSEVDRINHIYSKAENCTTIDMMSRLDELNQSGTQVYYKLDHHWTTRAAYEAYTSYIESIKGNVLPLSDFKEEVVTEDFYGTTYSKANLYNLQPDKITTYTNTNNIFEIHYIKLNETTDSFYNKEYLAKKDKYAMFLNGNQELIKINNKTINSDKNLLIIKDSYANCFVPFVANNFKTTHVIDPRYYAKSISEYIEENNIDEVLFLYNMHTLATDQGIFNIK
ncbi:MAG: hypothetical protein IKV94_04045 [Clostridia bacterium]|nr:hypothetical protein [Clostridia bacterium]